MEPIKPTSAPEPAPAEQSGEVYFKDPFDRQKIEQTASGWLGFFVKRKRITLLFMLAVLLLGVFSLLNIPREAEPEVKIPIAVVTTVYPGASPSDIEHLITDEIETRIEELDDIKSVSSQSMLGLSSITVEFEASADLEKSIDALTDKVDQTTGLPEDALDPIVTEVRLDDTPIITFSLGSTIPEQALKQVAETIQNELESISGISEVRLVGTQEREYLVAVRPTDAARFSLSLPQISGIIAASNFDTPLGTIDIEQKNYNIRTVAKIGSIEELRSIVLLTLPNGTLITLNDVADVREQSVERRSLSRLSVDGAPAQNTVSLLIHKKTGGNILDIVDESKARVAELKESGVIPAGVEVVEANDYSQFIRNDLEILGSSGIQAMALIFIILLISLSVREAIISLISVPTTFLISFIILYYLGYTLNSLVLFSLVLALGMLVDAFIVMLDGIFHNIRLGYTPEEAALLTISHYRDPLAAGALTTISAFLPMVLVSGIVGEYLEVLPVTLTVVLLSSLFVALTIAPTAASVFLKANSGIKKESLLEKFFINRVSRWYAGAVDRVLRSRLVKYATVTVTALLFFGSISLLAFGVIAVQLFPKVDINFSYIDIEMPIGTTLEKTDTLVREVENYLYTVPEIKSFVTTVGQGSSFGFTTGQSNEHVASVNITYVDLEERTLKSYEINDRIRQDLKKINEGKITVQEISSGPPTGAPIEVRITGPEIEQLQDMADQLIAIMEQTEGVINVETDKQTSPADVTFTFDRRALGTYGLTVADVSGALRTAIFGTTATEITQSGEEIDVRVQMNDADIDTVEEIKNLAVPNRTGQLIQLSSVADFSLEPAVATINHLDFERTIRVRADLRAGYNPAQMTQQLEQAAAAIETPSGYQFDFGGEVEDIEQSFSELWNVMIVAVLLIGLILVWEFDSYRKPLIVLISIPLSIIGVAVGLLLFGLPFSFSVFLGIISLAGISVNDAIILIDKASRNVKENRMPPRKAMAAAGRQRLQPIFLTTATTIVGIIPLAFADEFWLGLSISLVFGLLFGTLLQLFVIPMLYLKFEGKKDLRTVNESQ